MNTTEANPDSPTAVLARLLSTTYGPYAFGVVSMLAIWFATVQPELRRRDARTDQFETVATQMLETSITLRESATLNERTAQRLERAAALMEGSRSTQ